MITCCMDCERRGADCHSKCDEYLRQRAEHEAETAALRDIREQQGAMYRYTRDAKRRTVRRNDRQKGR